MDYPKFILLGLIAIAGTGNGFVIRQNRTDEKRKIEGGDVICIDKAPYQVYLKDDTGYFCGGALIRPNVVITAAHCVEDFHGPLFVVAGTDSSKLKFNEAKDADSITVIVDDYKHHPKYSYFRTNEADLKFDIAILQLEKKLPKTQKISPIEIATVDIKEGDELLLTGIGLAHKNAPAFSPCLKAYKPKVVNCKDALSTLKLNFNNFDGVICHKSPLGHTSRSGDSGGPMVNQEGKLVGVHTSSYKNDVCQTGVNVLHNMDWINEVISLFTNEV